MANQRMYLVCTECLEKPQTTLEECITCLSKYYPEGGWQFPDDFGATELKRFFEKHDHRGTLDGKYVRIVYDSELFEFAKERDEVLGRLAADLGSAHQARYS